MIYILFYLSVRYSKCVTLQYTHAIHIFIFILGWTSVKLGWLVRILKLEIHTIWMNCLSELLNLILALRCMSNFISKECVIFGYYGHIMSTKEFASYLILIQTPKTTSSLSNSQSFISLRSTLIFYLLLHVHAYTMSMALRIKCNDCDLNDE